MTTRPVTIVNLLGMHARAAARFVHLAARYDSRIRVAREGREMDGKSVMGLLLLAAARGSTITITADGRDELAAVDALTALVQSGFGEDDGAGAGEAAR
jgi:phosphocarrier protein